MSKWIKKELFKNFTKEKKEEAEAPQGFGLRRSELVWETPQKGSSERPKVYEGRFLPDKKGGFYRKYSYHMFQSGEKWAFILCPKTNGMDNYCPFCSSTSKLYQGTAADKKMAYNYKRKEKFVVNFFLVNDPRDPERDEDNRVNGKVRLYEFPQKVEMKLKEEITDTKNGYGFRIFDPSEEGHNFILKVLATKKDPNGNVWPDYSSSQFARISESLGTDDEIEKIMKQCVDLEDYIKSLEVGQERMIEVLKTEMLWDLVGEEYSKVIGLTAEKEEKQDDIDDSAWDKPKEEVTPEDEVTVDEKSDDDLSDDALLAELENY